jgi:hypothetical protein
VTRAIGALQRRMAPRSERVGCVHTHNTADVGFSASGAVVMYEMHFQEHTTASHRIASHRIA